MDFLHSLPMSSSGADIIKALFFTKLVAEKQRVVCASKGSASCSCGDDANLKFCANCGAACYGSKECQKSHWPSHKRICKLLRDHKPLISELPMPTQKAVLARLSLDVPPVHDEYVRRYGKASLSSLMIAATIMEARNLVESRSRNNLEDLLGSDERDHEQLLWRWQELSQDLMQFLESSPTPGTIFREKKYRPFSPPGPQQFRNTPLALQGILKNGITVVDIGFVDFGVVFDCLKSLSPEGDPVKIIVIDAEPFCVAKAKVMYEMAKEPSNSPRSVVEVWLSSLWSTSTSAAFSKAVTKILREQSSGLHEKIKKILLFWKHSPKISRAAGERFQIEKALQQSDIRFCTRACNLASERDRVDFVRYHFTKALYEDDSIAVGSPVMCTEDESVGIRQICENAFEAVPFGIFTWVDPSFQESRSLMERAHHYFESQMRLYMSLVQRGTIHFTPKVGVISPQNTSLLSELAALKPYLVSWSNVVDYVPPDEFHTMARTISNDDTMHFFHSINWCTRTFGVDIYDICSDARMHFFSAGLVFLEHCRLVLGGFVQPQGPFHFRNVCSYVLARKFINSFLRYFFEGQQVNCAGFFDGGSPLGIMNPLGRTDTTAFLAFAYRESGIHFPANAYDFTSDD